MRLELEGGGWIDLRDPEDVTEGARRPINLTLMKLRPEVREAMEQTKAMTKEEAEKHIASVTTSDDVGLLYEVNDLIAAALVEKWSYDIPLPATAESVCQLKGRDYDALQVEAAAALPRMFPSFTTNPDPASPTDPSAG